jgi:hypothetical protein
MDQTPVSVLEMAATIAAFSKSLSSDLELVLDAMRIAQDAVSADRLADRRGGRATRS